MYKIDNVISWIKYANILQGKLATEIKITILSTLDT